MTPDQVLDLLRECDAFLEGHFLLSSGKRSDRYFQCALALQYPDRAGKLAAALAEKVTPEVDVVVGPAMGAVVWAQEVGRALGRRAIFTERVPTDNGTEFSLRRNFRIEPGERVLVVEDVVTTGGSAREVVALLRSIGAEVVGVGSIVNRSGGNPFEDLGLPLFALADVQAQVWDADDDPLAAAGSVPIKPGSRPSAAGA